MELSPKEQAEQLIKAHETAIAEELLGGEKLFHYTAIQCSLITVNKIMTELPMYKGELNQKWKFWDDVKYELFRLLRHLNAQEIVNEKEK